MDERMPLNEFFDRKPLISFCGMGRQARGIAKDRFRIGGSADRPVRSRDTACARHTCATWLMQNDVDKWEALAFLA
jgi:hypothetical protein